MNSFTFSFKSLALALGIILLIEAACALGLRPGVTDRADFASLRLFHRSLILDKLNDFANSSPDIIQVGDSSGFHGVRPEIVMNYLGGLKYLNLSCCAPLGYNGYYGIADFMLRRNPSIKVLVLYVNLRDLPRADMIDSEYKLGEAMEALNSPLAYLRPATLALRQKISDAYERPTRLDLEFSADARNSIRHNHGWWAEHDPRLSGRGYVEYWRRICGETGVAIQDDGPTYYSYDPIHGQRSYMVSEFERFAQLAANYGAKFIILFHPYSCRALEGTLIPARLKDLRAVEQRFTNVTALPDEMVELWPTGQFTSAAHLRVGYDEINSRRVGELLARFLGINARPEAPDTAETANTVEAVRREVGLATGSWRAEGAILLDHDEPSRTWRLADKAAPGLHRIEKTLADLTPGQTIVLSFPARPVGARGILVELLSAGTRGGAYCDLHDGTAQRAGAMFDVGVYPQPDGWLRCWAAMSVNDTAATLRLSLLDRQLQPAYAGDGRSGAEVGEIELRQTPHFLHTEPSPW